MFLQGMDGREISALAASLAIAMSEGLTERQVTKLASFFAVLGQSLGAIASVAAGADIETGASSSGGTSGGSATGSGGSSGTGMSGNAVETSAGYQSITGTRTRTLTELGTNKTWHTRTLPDDPNNTPTNPPPANTDGDQTKT